MYAEAVAPLAPSTGKPYFRSVGKPYFRSVFEAVNSHPGVRPAKVGCAEAHDRWLTEWLPAAQPVEPEGKRRCERYDFEVVGEGYVSGEVCRRNDWQDIYPCRVFRVESRKLSSSVTCVNYSVFTSVMDGRV